MNEKSKDELIKYISTNIPLIYLNDFQQEEVSKTAEEIRKAKIVENVFYYNVTYGFNRNTNEVELDDYTGLINGLTNILDTNGSCVVIVQGAENIFNDSNSENSRVLFDILNRFVHKVQTSKALKASIIFDGYSYSIPLHLRQGAMIIENGVPDEDEIRRIVLEFLADQKIEDFVSGNHLKGLEMPLKGLKYYEIIQALSFLYYEYGLRVFNEPLQPGMEEEIYNIKEQMLKKSGTLSLVEASEKLEDIIGLDVLKGYIKRERKYIKHHNIVEDNRLMMPKGILILGEPGTGKSMTAKATANILGLKLIKFDMSKILGKYVGESEKNMREILRIIDGMSPCVLWIDEIEKAFAGVGNDDNEVLRRVFGLFLTWMSDDNKGAFVVATANNVEGVLPPEFLRKGRFDDIFYVSKPSSADRAVMFEKMLEGKGVHLNFSSRHGRATYFNDFAVDTAGFTGAEIDYICNRIARDVLIDSSKPKRNKDRIAMIKNQIKNEIKLIKNQKDLMMIGSNYDSLKIQLTETLSKEIEFIKKLKESNKKDPFDLRMEEVINRKIDERIDEEVGKMINKRINKNKYRGA